MVLKMFSTVNKNMLTSYTHVYTHAVVIFYDVHIMYVHVMSSQTFRGGGGT